MAPVAKCGAPQAKASAYVHVLNGNADTVEFCPIESYEHVLAAGTYTLIIPENDKEVEDGDGDGDGGAKSRREGNLYLFGVSEKTKHLEDGDGNGRENDGGGSQSPHTITPPPPAHNFSVKKHFVQSTSGIFDLKWAPTEIAGRPCLAQASADGTVSFYRLISDDVAGFSLSETAKVICSSSAGAMCLSLDWYHPGRNGGDRSEVCGRYGGDRSEVCGGYGGDRSEVCGGYGGDSSEVCGGYGDDAAAEGEEELGLAAAGSRRHHHLPISRNDPPSAAAAAAAASVCDRDGDDLDIAVSLSNGWISIVHVGQSGARVGLTWSAHLLEVWTAAFDTWRSSTLYSGADDCAFKGWDLRCCTDPDRPIFKDVKSHTMGLCSIQSSPFRENVICTGSYDEKVRLWDLRMVGRPTMVHSVPTGGGVWRVKWHPCDPDRILCALMHNGFAILDVKGTGKGEGEGEEGDLKNCHVEIAETYMAHESLGYGADWSRRRCASPSGIAARGSSKKKGVSDGRSRKGIIMGSDSGLHHDDVEVEECMQDGERSSSTSSLIATCSFYDRQLHVWKSGAAAGSGNCSSFVEACHAIG